MIPFVSIVGKSGSGKTVLLEKLIPVLKARGFRVAVVKHHAHPSSLDTPGKDSWRLAEAGADEIVVASPIEISHLVRLKRELTLNEIAATIQDVDLILAEGFNRDTSPKIEVARAEAETVLIAPKSDLIAVVSDLDMKFEVPRFGLDDVDRIAEFIIRYFGLDERRALECWPR